MSRTTEEQHLLDKLAAGVLDGVVGDERKFREYKSILCGIYIKDGVPVTYRESEPKHAFNGKGHERISESRKEEHYDTDDRKLEFLQRYGWLIQDTDAKTYSAKFKPKKR